MLNSRYDGISLLLAPIGQFGDWNPGHKGPVSAVNLQYLIVVQKSRDYTHITNHI
jgi:hypothetical protein